MSYIYAGNTEYLSKRVNENGFHDVLLQYILDNLGLVECNLHVHCGTGSVGKDTQLTKGEEVRLTNAKAIYLNAINKGILIG